MSRGDVTMTTFGLADGVNFGRLKPCTAIAAAMQSRRSALGDHIDHIVFVAVEEQMARSNASGIVATMANESACGDWSMDQFVGDAVRSELRSVLAFDESIALRMCRPRPDPAASKSAKGKLRQESNLERRFWSSGASHHRPRFILSRVRPRNQKFRTPVHKAWSASVHVCKIATPQPAPALTAATNAAILAAQYSAMNQ